MLENITVTEICEVFNVFSQKGQYAKIENRKSFGLSLCNSGKITYTLDGQSAVSDREHVVFLPQGKTYELHRDKTGTFPVINFHCVGFECNAPTALPLSDPQACLADFEQLRRLSLLEENRLRALGIFYGLLHKIGSQSTAEPLLLPAVRYLEKNYGNPTVTNEYLASLCGISEVYFRRLFVEHYKTTPHRYVVDIRIGAAKRLLSEDVLKISEVAYTCGFTEQYHFCRVFKEKIGMTPSEYRKINRTYAI